MQKNLLSNRYIIQILVFGLVLFVSYFASLYNYLLFHTLAELFSIIIACGIFIFAWNSQKFIDNNYLLFIGIAYLFVAGLDLLHLLTYHGMNIFIGYKVDLAIKFWISARYIESLSLLIAPVFLTHKLRTNLVLLIYSIIFLILLILIFGKMFPECYIENVGLTQFKINSEYLISVFLLISLFILYQQRSQFDTSVLKLISASILLTIFSELAFTFYINVYGFSNFVGHIFKILSFYLIYKAILQTGITEPYSLLCKNLKETENSLREAKEKAELASQAKSHFLANMSHEFRTPLTGILGYAQILQSDSSLTTEQQHGCRIIEQSGNHLLALINDVLDFAKAESGKIELYETDFNLNSFLLGISGMLKLRAEQKGINFVLELANELPNAVHGDERRLRQILLNLLGNAIKFTDKGSVSLKVSFNQQKFYFKIEDTGIGISPDDLETIFQPFEQVGEQNRQTNGTGLGLAISKNLVELMGGQLSVSSKINQGTQFWFELALPVLDYNVAQVTQQPKILVEADNDDNSISQTIVFPPLEEIKNLYELTLIGNVNKLNQRLAILSESESLKPFVTKIQDFLIKYQLDELSEWLQGQIKNDSKNFSC